MILLSLIKERIPASGVSLAMGKPEQGTQVAVAKALRDLTSCLE